MKTGNNIYIFIHEKATMEQPLSLFLEAPTRFELVIEVLQTFALPLGHGAKYSDSNGNRTRVTAVKGRCLNRLTMEPNLMGKSVSFSER